MSDPRVITVELPREVPLGVRCSKSMKGKTIHKDGGHRPSWTRPCPNTASVIHRGRAYCAIHAPKGSMTKEQAQDAFADHVTTILSGPSSPFREPID